MRFSGNPDEWFATHEAWPEAVAALRTLVLESGLEETIKWGQPCYMVDGANVLIVSSRAAGGTLSFFRGALLDDPDGVLLRPGEHARHGRYVVYASADAVVADRARIGAWIAQAIDLTRRGVRVPKLEGDIDYVAELRERLEHDDAFRTAFEALTPGRRRGYNLYFQGAKQASTREGRIDRCTERILHGKGLHDCICGQSARYPRCDGTHKNVPRAEWVMDRPKTMD